MSRACGASGTPWFFGSVTDVPRVETGTHLGVPAARCARALHERSPPKREQGMPGARCTRGLVCKAVRKNAHEHTGSAEAIRHSLRNGFTAYGALSSATNSSCHRHRRIEDFAAPGWANKISADLTPATGAGTTRFCRTQPPVFAKRLNRALAPFVWRAMVAHGKPALRSRSRPTLPRPPHPIPTFVTTADAPRAE
jgi:hypothetical protein